MFSPKVRRPVLLVIYGINSTVGPILVSVSQAKYLSGDFSTSQTLFSAGMGFQALFTFAYMSTVGIYFAEFVKVASLRLKNYVPSDPTAVVLEDVLQEVVEKKRKEIDVLRPTIRRV